MMKHQQEMTNENGFTLIESLIVLSVFLVMSFSTVLLLQPTNHFFEKQLFFSTLQSDFFYAQQYALSHQEDVTIHIRPNENYYYIKANINRPKLVERHYSSRVEVNEGSMNYFQFNRNGNINKFGSMYVDIGNQTYRMVILIGRGRFYVVKE